MAGRRVAGVRAWTRGATGRRRRGVGRARLEFNQDAPQPCDRHRHGAGELLGFRAPPWPRHDGALRIRFGPPLPRAPAVDGCLRRVDPNGPSAWRLRLTPCVREGGAIGRQRGLSRPTGGLDPGWDRLQPRRDVHDRQGSRSAPAADRRHRQREAALRSGAGSAPRPSARAAGADREPAPRPELSASDRAASAGDRLADRCARWRAEDGGRQPAAADTLSASSSRAACSRYPSRAQEPTEA